MTAVRAILRRSHALLRGLPWERALVFGRGGDLLAVYEGDAEGVAIPLARAEVIAHNHPGEGGCPWPSWADLAPLLDGRVGELWVFGPGADDCVRLWAERPGRIPPGASPAGAPAVEELPRLGVALERWVLARGGRWRVVRRVLP